VGYGAYIPYYRMKTSSLDREYGTEEGTHLRSSGFSEKTVPNFDQDSLTMGVDSTRSALRMSGIEGAEIDSIYFGTTNKAYRMKPSAITLAEAIGATPHVKASDIECSQRGATISIMDALAVVNGGIMGVRNSLVVGADTPRVREGDSLDVGAGSGSASLIFGNEDKIANFIGYETYATDIPDQWWGGYAEYPTNSGRFQGEPAYYKHLLNATRILLLKMDLKIDDVHHIVLSHPSRSFVISAARKLGIDPSSLDYLDIISRIGNPFNASTLLSLSHVLDICGPGEMILMVQYGSGGGADAILMETTDLLAEKRKHLTSLSDQLDHCSYISYNTYRRRK